MCPQKRDSMIKKALKSLCCSNGWSYGVFWGFDLANSLLLTLKEAYYEEQMGALIDSMLLQAHVLGGGVIGQAAFMKNHRWMYSDALDETQNSLGSFDSLDLFQEDSEFFWQFSMGIKTISVISVEPWGVVQFGSTHKIFETEGFVDEVKQVFREMDKCSEIKITENEAYSDSQVKQVSNTQQLSSGGICNESLVLPSLSFPSISTSNFIFPTPENSFQIECSNLFDCSSSFSNPMDYEFWRNYSSLNAPLDFSSSFSPQITDLSYADGLVSNLSGKNDKLENLPARSSVTDAFRSCNELVKDSELIDSFGLEHGWNLNLEKRGGNSLFSQLGIDHLLDGIASTSSSSAAKRRKTDDFSWSHNNVKFERLASFDRKSTNNVELDSEELTKEAHSCVDQEQGKSKKRKAKAKAGTRPRPKDRQMIQDRLSELRELIPNGEKMSIDRLLERTIRHLNFMQSLTKHAATLNQIDTPKSVEVIKNRSSNGGVTWACEVGDQNMICPLIVEDLSTPGQMLIEMLCEEQGLFLEIVDIIRGFGLVIRKGVMEVRETKKLWAHFTVEAEGNRGVSRHEIFSSLIHLLQMTGQSASYDSHDHGNGNVVSSGMHALNNFEAFPINFPDALQCGSL